MVTSGMSDNLLQGLTVLDLSQNLPGPYCSRILADMGARIIKVEPPRRGDTARMLPEFFQVLNAGKESISIDLKTEDGVKIVQRLAMQADVVLEGFRPGVADKLGLGFERLRALNKKIIYCSISGFGQSGPMRDVPAHDLNLQAFSGYNAFNKSGGHVVSPIPIADYVASTNAVSAILAALLKTRLRKQESEESTAVYLDVAMSEGLAHMVDVWAKTHQDPARILAEINRSLAKSAQSSLVSETLLTRPVQKVVYSLIKKLFGKGILNIIPTYGLFKTADGHHICLGIVDENHFWKIFCEQVGGALEKYRNLSLNGRILLAPWLKLLIRLKFRQKSISYWLDLLTVKNNLPVSPVHKPQDLFKSEQFQVRGMTTKLHSQKYISSPFAPKNMPIAECVLGANGERILLSSGYSNEEIRRLFNADIVFGPSKPKDKSSH